MTRYVFVTGGVASSLGKGLATASLGALLQSRGFSVRLRKLDPYLNLDPGTMSPYEHGEVYVTNDGAETDLDLGHYERFTGTECSRDDNVTAGRIFQTVLDRERRGDYLGQTVQIIPHVTDAIRAFIGAGDTDVDFMLVEIGGTVGDIESLPFLEAIRQMKNDRPLGSTLNVHLTLLPFLAGAGEVKTKPTQHSVKELRSIGIQPDVLLVRCERPIESEICEKIALFCNVRPESVVPAVDQPTIHAVPEAYHAAALDAQVLVGCGLDPSHHPADLSPWMMVNRAQASPEGKVDIAVVGKYTKFTDAYKSLLEALVHGGIANRLAINVRWIAAEAFAKDAHRSATEGVHGLLVPGGFGHRGAEGKIAACRFAREFKVPFLGICYGMQMAVIECARNLAGIPDASSSEFGPTHAPVVGLLTEWEIDGKTIRRTTDSGLGGTMRLGACPADLVENSLIHTVYGRDRIWERHRHRYEVNINYRPALEKAGLRISATSPDGRLPEAVERADHPWFVGVQFHPELTSRPLQPHPLFREFIAAARDRSRLI